MSFKLKSMECELGISIEIKGIWYRLGSKVGSDATGEVTLKDIKTQFNKSWDLLETEISNKVKELEG